MTWCKKHETWDNKIVVAVDETFTISLFNHSEFNSSSSSSLFNDESAPYGLFIVR